MANLDERVSTLELIINNGNIVAHSLLIEPVNSTTVFYNNGMFIDSTVTFTENSITALTEYTSGYFSTVYCSVGGKSLFTFNITSQTVADITAGYFATTTSINNSSFTGFISTIQNTSAVVIYDDPNAAPLRTEHIFISFTLVPYFDNYSSTEVNVTGLTVLKDTSSTLKGNAFELLRANYVDSTVTVTITSGLKVLSSGTGTSYVDTAVDSTLANSAYVYDKDVILTLAQASLLVTSDIFSTSIAESDTNLTSGVYYVRTILPGISGSISNLADSSGLLAFNYDSKLEYYSNANLDLSTLDINISSYLNLTAFIGGTQAETDSNLTILLGSGLENYIRLDVFDNPPTVYTSDMTVDTYTTLGWKPSDFTADTVIYSTYSGNLVRTTSDFSNTVNYASQLLIPYGQINGVSGSYSLAQQDYAFMIYQQIGQSLYTSNLVLVSDTAIYTDALETQVNPINVSYTTGSFIKGVSFDSTTFQTDNPSIYGIKYTVSATGVLTAINDDTKIFNIVSTNLITDTTQPSMVLTIDTNILNGYSVISNDSPIVTGTTYGISTESGTLTAEFFMIPSEVHISRAMSSQIGPATQILAKLLRVDDLGGGDYKYRISLKSTYSDANTDFAIIEYDTSIGSTTALSDLDAFVTANYLYAPINVDNIFGFYYRFPISELISGNIGRESLITLPSNIREIIIMSLYNEYGIIDSAAVEPNWDPRSVLFLVSGADFYYYLQDNDIYINELDGIANVLQFTNPVSGFAYNLDVLLPVLSPDYNITTDSTATLDSTSVLTTDSYLSIKFNNPYYFAAGDSIEFYYFFRPIAQLINLTSYETNGPYYINSYDTLNATNDGVELNNFDVSGMVVSSQTFNTVPAVFDLDNGSGLVISSGVSAGGSGPFEYAFLSGDSRQLLDISTDFVVGFNSTTYPVIFNNRTIRTQIVDGTFNTIGGTNYFETIIYDELPLQVNYDVAGITFTTSSETNVNLRDTGFRFQQVNDYGYYFGYVTSRTLFIKPLTAQYKLASDVSYLHIKPSRDIELTFASTNAALSEIKFQTVQSYDSNTVTVRVDGDDVIQTINTTTTLIDNADLTNPHYIDGLIYNLNQTFLPSNLSTTVVLRAPRATVSFPNFNMDTIVFSNTTTMPLTVSGAGTGSLFQMNISNIYDTTEGAVYTMVFQPAKITVTNDTNTPLAARFDSNPTLTTSPIAIGSTLYVEQIPGTGNENLIFLFSHRAGFNNAVEYSFDAGVYIVNHYILNDTDENITGEYGGTYYKFRQQSARFAAANVDFPGSTGYQPQDINYATNSLLLPIKFSATQQYFLDALASSGMLVVQDNDLYPLSIRKTGPNTIAEYSLVVANDVANIYRLVTVDGITIGTGGGTEINQSTLSIGNY